MAAMDELDELPTTPLTPERQKEAGLLQFIIDEVEEEPSGILEEIEGEGAEEMEDTGAEMKHTRRRRTEVERLIDGDKRRIRGIRESISERMTRQSQFTIMPFIVNQEDEPTCAYVTLSKVLLFNLMGILMDIDIPYHEKLELHRFMKYGQVLSSTPNENRLLIAYGKRSIKGYVLIVFFFYFFDWIKMNNMRPSYLISDGMPVAVTKHKKDVSFYRVEIEKLYTYLRLKTKRLGGITFAGHEWVQAITGLLEENAARLQWKITSLCTLRTKFSNGCDTFTYDEEGETNPYLELCRDILLPITNLGIKVIITLYEKENVLHDVMLVGIENDCLLISNSWGHSIDVIPIESLPRLTLTNSPAIWLIFQFTFLLPVMDDSLNGLDVQYNFASYQQFKEIITRYKLPVFDKLDPTTLELPLSGGKKTRRTSRRNKSTKRNKKKVINYEGLGSRKRLDC